MKNLYFLLLAGLFLIPAESFAQFNERNLSIQVGYQYKRLRLGPLNFALDSIANQQTPRPQEDFETIGWTPGIVGAIAYHRRRLNLRIQFDNYRGTSEATIRDSANLAVISGWNLGFQMSSQLIGFRDKGGFYVGGSINVSQINTGLGKAPGGATPEVTTTSSVTKPSFSILLPFRYAPIPQVEFSLEPYFQVFFSPTRYVPFSNVLNGIDATEANSGRLIGEFDHFGANLRLIVYLFPR